MLFDMVLVLFLLDGFLLKRLSFLFVDFLNLNMFFFLLELYWFDIE